MITPSQYVPIIKWKAGEYGALKALKDIVKDRIHPLIQIVPPGYDNDTTTVSTTIEQRLDKFLKTYVEIWGERPAFIDFNLLPSHHKLKNGQLPVKYIFDSLELIECPSIPVISFGRDELYLMTVGEIVKNQKHGVKVVVVFSKHPFPKTG